MEIERTADPVRLSFLQSVLAGEGIEASVFGPGAGALWPGAFPVRLMVEDRDADVARWAISDAMRAVERDQGSPS